MYVSELAILKPWKLKTIFVQPDSRFTLDKKENGNYLIIGLARISDEGEVSLFAQSKESLICRKLWMSGIFIYTKTNFSYS